MQIIDKIYDNDSWKLNTDNFFTTALKDQSVEVHNSKKVSRIMQAVGEVE